MTASCLGLAYTESAHAGAQRQEPLTDAVRTALSAAIANTAPPIAPFTDANAQASYLHWLAVMSLRLQTLVPDGQTRRDLLQTAWYESQRAGLPVALVLGLIEVESHFRKFAISAAGARGYMQIMPFWVSSLGDGDASKLFHLQTNLRFGCVILQHYLTRENSDLVLALGRYNGSRGKLYYPRSVLAKMNGWMLRD